MQTKEELNLADTIKGEINRMCVTNDIAELDTMALHARGNIKILQSLRYASITADTPQTESTGSPIGDYRDGVGAWQTERMTEEEIDTMLAKVLVGQTDCGWK